MSPSSSHLRFASSVNRMTYLATARLETLPAPVHVVVPGHLHSLLTRSRLNRRQQLDAGRAGRIEQSAHDARPLACLHVFDGGIEVGLELAQMTAQVPITRSAGIASQSVPLISMMTSICSSPSTSTARSRPRPLRTSRHWRSGTRSPRRARSGRLTERSCGRPGPPPAARSPQAPPRSSLSTLLSITPADKSRTAAIGPTLYTADSVGLARSVSLRFAIAKPVKTHRTVEQAEADEPAARPVGR